MNCELKAGWCPFCRQGWVVFAKDGGSQQLLVHCTECDTLWTSPILYILQAEGPLPSLDGPLICATMEELVAMNWEAFVLTPDREIPFLDQ